MCISHFAFYISHSDICTATQCEFIFVTKYSRKSNSITHETIIVVVVMVAVQYIKWISSASDSTWTQIDFLSSFNRHQKYPTIVLNSYGIRQREWPSERIVNITTALQHWSELTAKHMWGYVTNSHWLSNYQYSKYTHTCVRVRLCGRWLFIRLHFVHLLLKINVVLAHCYYKITRYSIIPTHTSTDTHTHTLISYLHI